ncbi:MAG: RNA polymerase factor sigma-54 [Planctomycetota bacterium]
MAAPEFKQNIEAKQELQQRLTPSLLQTVTILQMPLQELAEHIEQEVTENPFLEISPPQFKSLDTIKTDTSSNILEDLEDERSYRHTGNLEDEDDLPFWERLKDEEEGIYDKIRMQISILEIDEKTKNIIYKILDKVDMDGFLRISYDELLEYIKSELKIEVQLSELKNALEILRTKITPQGIGSTTVQECLLSQINKNDKDYELLASIITTILANPPNKFDIQTLMSKYNKTYDQINKALEIISKLNMAPLANYNNEIIRRIKADAEIYYVDNELVVNLSNPYIPELVINKEYIKLLKEKKSDKFLKNKYANAKKLIKDLNLRKMFLLKILQVIIQEQKDFFENGIVSLKSLNLEMISQKTGLSKSTISRVIANKYIQTPRGLFNIKFFLASSPSRNTKIHYSKVAICDKIKELIEQENKLSPYTDTQLKNLIERKLNIRLARRTITKFRLEMNIPSASVRRIQYQTQNTELNTMNKET